MKAPRSIDIGTVLNGSGRSRVKQAIVTLGSYDFAVVLMFSCGDGGEELLERSLWTFELENLFASR